MKSQTMKLIAWLLLGFLLCAPVSAFAEPKIVQIGDTPVGLPEMGGFQELYGRSPDFDRLVEHFVPAGNKLLAVYLSDEDVRQLNAHPEGGLKRYILVETTGQDVRLGGPEDFQAVKDNFNKQAGSGNLGDDKNVADAMDKVSGYMHDQFNVQAQLKIGETKYLGRILDTADSTAVLIVTNYGITTAKGTESHPVVAGLGVEALRSRVLMIFVYSDYRGQVDADFVSETTKRFFGLAEDMNGGAAAASATASGGSSGAAAPGGASGASGTEDVDFGGAMGWATKGAIIVALLAAIALLLPKIIKATRRNDEAR